MSIARRSPLSFIRPLALRARVSLLLTYLLCPVLCQFVGSRLDNASPAVAFTPPPCNNGQTVSVDRLPDSCDHTWFIISNGHNSTSHATRSSTSRVVLHFQALEISWFSAPVTQLRGSADIHLNGLRVERVQITPYNSGPDVPTWSKGGLNPDILHNLTIVPVGDDIISVDSFALISISSAPSDQAVPSPMPLIAAASNADPASMKDASSGAVISLASLAAVAIVVVICGGCFLLGRRRKSPGFHMPTVLVDIESGVDPHEAPSPTTVRAWRVSTHKSMADAAAAGEPTHDRYPPSRPPSYRSARDSLHHSESTSHGHDDHRR